MRLISIINKSAFATHLNSRVYVLYSALSHTPTQGVSVQGCPQHLAVQCGAPMLAWTSTSLGVGSLHWQLLRYPFIPPWYTVEGGGTPYGDCLVSWSLNVLMFDVLLVPSRVNARTPPSASSSLPLYVCLIVKEEHLLLSVGPPGTQVWHLIATSSQETPV